MPYFYWCSAPGMNLIIMVNWFESLFVWKYCSYIILKFWHVLENRSLKTVTKWLKSWKNWNKENGIEVSTLSNRKLKNFVWNRKSHGIQLCNFSFESLNAKCSFNFLNIITLTVFVWPNTVSLLKYILIVHIFGVWIFLVYLFFPAIQSPPECRHMVAT